MDTVAGPRIIYFVLFCLAPFLAAALFCAILRRCPLALARQPGWVRLAILNALALAFFLSAAFLAGEIYYRFVYDTTDSFDYTFASKRWFARYYQYNSVNLRDNLNYPEQLVRGARRITFIGDSFTAGHGVKDVEQRFANRLRKLHPDWDVQVLAVNGMDTGAELDSLNALLGQRYQMDLVVLVYCLNDVADLMPEWKRAEQRIFADSTSRNWLVTHSYFADTYYFRLKARLDPNIPNYFSIVREAYRGALWPAQQRRLEQFRELVEKGGGRLAVATFPFLHELGEHYEFQSVHEQLDSFWRATGVPHLDLLPTYRQFSKSDLVVNQLDAHPNEFAHGLAARAIDTFLQAQLKALPPPAPRTP